MRTPEIINYKGQKIIYLDFSGMKDKDEIFRLENEGVELICKHRPKTALTLTNMEGMHFNNEIRKFFEQAVKKNSPYVRASAVIGLNGLISIFYNSFVKVTGRDLRSLRTKEEALEYLYKKAQVPVPA